MKPVILFTLTTLMAAAAPQASLTPEAHLRQDALLEILNRGAPILGFNTGCDPHDKTCNWMAHFPDNTKLVHMNLPGTHDTATWNYTAETQASLIRYTGPIPPSDTFRCQEHSIFQSLNSGVRVFDLRYAYNPGNDTIGFHHSQALLAPTTTLSDVLFGLYSWLDAHPTEALLISLKYEGGTGTPNDVALQEKLFADLNSGPAKRYWLQNTAKLGTLGEARGKITLLQRFDYNLLPSSPEFSKRIGIPLLPSQWLDNEALIKIVYNSNASPQGIAWIEDFYEPSPNAGDSSIAASVIEQKFNATVANLVRASTQNPDDLFITFASAEWNEGGVFPRIMALGDGQDISGVNQRLIQWLQGRPPTERRGIVMLDFYDTVPGLVEAVIGL